MLTKVYQFNNAGSCDSREVTFEFWWGPINLTEQGECGSGTNEEERNVWQVTLDSVAPVDIDTWIQFDRFSDSGWATDVQTYTQKLTIAAGTLSKDFTFYDWIWNQWTDFGSGGCENEYGYVMEETIQLLDQPTTPPVCIPPDCYLGFTGVTATVPTQRGASDGTIYAGITGQTGTTINWFLNSVLQSGSGTTHTFTGLSANEYFIKAEEYPCLTEDSVIVNQGEFRTGDFIIVSPTSTVKAVENPVVLFIRTATNSNDPEYSVNTFTIGGTIADVSIDFNLTFPYEYNAQFLSRGYPDRNTYFLESVLKNQIGVTVGSNTETEIATSLAESFQNDAILSRMYFITSSGTTITLKAKVMGSGYDLTSTNTTIVGSNVTLTNVTSGVAQYDGQIISNYSVYTELFVNETVKLGETPVNSDYFRVAELELPFSQDNSHQFNFGPILKNFVDSPFYDLIRTGITYLPNYITSYYVKYGEKYPLIENTNTKKKRLKGATGYGWVLNAALNFEDINDMSDYFPVSAPAYDLMFLNTAPNTKYSHRQSDEYIYFPLMKDYPASVYLMGNIYMYDGSVHQNVNFYNISTGTTAGGIIGASVGYSSLGLSSYETTSKIRKVEVWVSQTIVSTTSIYAGPLSYYLEIDEQPETFNITFLSKLGTFETYSFTGERIEGQEIERSQYQRSYYIDNDGAATKGFQYNSIYDTKYTKTWVVNTGIIDEDNFDFLIGMLQSNKIYRYDIPHQNYLVVKGHTATKSTNTNEYSLQITFAETISENNISS